MQVRVFLSFSGDHGRDVAVALRDLFRAVPGCDAFVADEDVHSGADWRRLITEQLLVCDFAVVCLTPDALARPWVLFEAGVVLGARARTDGTPSPVVPYLVHVAPNEVPGPLQAYKAVVATEADTRRLVRERLGVVDVDELFACSWPGVESAVRAASASRTLQERLDRVQGLAAEGVTHVWRRRSDARASMLADISAARSSLTMVARVYLSELVKDTAALAAALAASRRPLLLRVAHSDPEDAGLMRRQHAEEDPERLRCDDPDAYAAQHVRRVSRMFVERAVADAGRRGGASITTRWGLFRGWLTPFSLLAVDDRVLYVSTYAAGAGVPGYGSFGPCLRLEATQEGGALLRAFQDDLSFVMDKASWT